MHILILPQFYHPTIGSTEQYVRNPCVELASRGHEVAVATIWLDGQPKFEVNKESFFYYKKIGKQLKLR